jgi:hypothetical protein
MPTYCACGCGLRVSYAGAYRKGHQPAGTSRDPEGKIKAASAIHNPINNPINNRKVQERARVENEERIAKMPKQEDVISEAGAAMLAKELSTTATGSLDGCTLEELLGFYAEDGYPNTTGDPTAT